MCDIQNREGATMRRGAAFLCLAVVLTACTPGGSASAAPGGLATADPPTTVEGYSEAEQTSILSQSIELLYATDPQPEWYASFLSVDVADQWAEVRTSLSEADVELAESMCRDTAAATFDDDAQPIGVTDVLVFGTGGVDLADCDVPRYGRSAHG
jgi:hypothetical protein